jgi:hypothetical protein
MLTRQEAALQRQRERERRGNGVSRLPAAAKMRSRRGASQEGSEFSQKKNRIDFSLVLFLADIEEKTTF